MRRLVRPALVCLTAALLLAATAPAGASGGADPAAVAADGRASGRPGIPLRVMTPTAAVWAGLAAQGHTRLSGAIAALDPAAAYTPGPRVGVLGAPESRSGGKVLAPTTFRTLAILVDFTDEPSQVGAAFFDTLVFGRSGTRTVNRYYAEASYGLLDVVTLHLPSTLGWQRAPQTYDYYVAGNYCIDAPYPRNCQRLAEDITAAVNPVVDFSRYDNDGDGWVDTVFIVHAGPGAEFTGSRNDVWSHSWGTYTGPAYDGVRVGSYTIEPEYWQSPGDMTHGVYVHELGHALGLPDLYDYDNSSAGVGRWSLMAGGSWNGTRGNTPALLDAWSRLYLGFNDAVSVGGAPQTVALPSVQDNQNAAVLRLDGANPNEYWLLENRQQIGSDAALPGAGLLIWHVDEAAYGNDAECRQADNHLCSGPGRHFLVALEQADGLYQLEYGTSQGNGGDPFPGSAGKRAFGFGTNPNTSSYYTGDDLHVKVEQISDSAPVMTARITIGDFPPGLFGKAFPADGATGRPPGPVLLWGTEAGAAAYEYCLDTTDDDACSSAWVSTGAATQATLAGLAPATTYFWQVRAVGGAGATYADGGAWWSFATGPLPAAFSKGSPADGSTYLPLLPTLSWGVSGAADGYEYCADATDDDACGGAWVDAGTASSAGLPGLESGTTYFWQVRAHNAFGYTYADGGAWWSLATGRAPEAFGKSGPADGAAGQDLLLTLSWEAAAGAAAYQYCYDATNDGACAGPWDTAGLALAVAVGPLTPGETYFWQVRAINSFGETAADGGSWWEFSTGSPPGAFTKAGPADGAMVLSGTPALSWQAAPGAVSYEYCLDTTDDGICGGPWSGAGNATSAVPAGLARGVAYFWQVRAINSWGATAADGGAWWRLVAPVLQEITLVSWGAADGWVLESSSDSARGGSTSAAFAPTGRVGDDDADRQYRSILHFDTSQLPEGAVVVAATLRVKRESLAGNPFAGHGLLQVDMKNGWFHGNAALERFDFHAAGSRGNVGRFIAAPNGGWYRAPLRPAALPLITAAESTQLRLRFATGDDDDQAADYLSFWTGDAPAAADRPQLIVTYYLP